MTDGNSNTLIFLGNSAVRVATLGAPMAIFLALPPFYNGFWVQVEGAMPWLHWASALAALGCGVLCFAGEPRARNALAHPLVLVPVSIFILSAIELPMTTLPGLSIFGAPEHGFGALAFLDLAALTAAALVTTADPTWRRAAVAAALVSIAGAYALDFLFRSAKGWAPFFFGDYLAFYAIYAFAICGVLARGRRWMIAIGVVLLIVLVLQSSNRAAVLAVGGAAVIVAALPRAATRRTLAITAFLAPIVVGVAIVVVGTTWQEPYRDVLLGELPATAANLFADSWASLWSRAMLVVVGASTLIDSPWLLLTGTGWGHYNEALLANLPLVEGRLHELIGTSRVYWDALVRADFHSHNQYFEALLSSGVIGATLMPAYGAALVACADGSRRRLAFFTVVTLTVLQSFWFQMPHSLPVMALAFVILVVPREGAPPPSLAANVSMLTATLGAVATAAFLVVSGGLSVADSSHARDLLRRIRAASDFTASELRFRTGLGEIYEATLMQAAYSNLGAAQSVDWPYRDSDLRAIAALLGEALNVPGPTSLKLEVSTLNVISGLIFTHPAVGGQFDGLDAAYDESVRRLLARAPRRTDLTIPYFNHLLVQGREREIATLAGRILAIRPEDPVALWFSGVVLLGDPGSAEHGMRSLKRSLERGIRNQMPIPPELLEIITK